METMTCRSCGKNLMIVNHERTGKPAPVEAEPVENGNIMLNPDGTYGIAPKGYEWPEGAKRYQSHYVSCPSAKGWREGTIWAKPPANEPTTPKEGGE